MTNWGKKTEKAGKSVVTRHSWISSVSSFKAMFAETICRFSCMLSAAALQAARLAVTTLNYSMLAGVG
jgi:hypothetical protein